MLTTVFIYVFIYLFILNKLPEVPEYAKMQFLHDDVTWRPG